MLILRCCYLAPPDRLNMLCDIQIARNSLKNRNLGWSLLGLVGQTWRSGTGDMGQRRWGMCALQHYKDLVIYTTIRCLCNKWVTTCIYRKLLIPVVIGIKLMTSCRVIKLVPRRFSPFIPSTKQEVKEKTAFVHTNLDSEMTGLLTWHARSNIPKH